MNYLELGKSLGDGLREFKASISGDRDDEPPEIDNGFEEEPAVFPFDTGHLAVPEDHQHEHGPECGHPAVPQGDHVDYVHDGHRHAPHGSHYDEH